jgi:type II secretory pathway pseudopilin PulG
MAAVRARQDDNGTVVEDGRPAPAPPVLNIPNPPRDDSPAASRSQGLVRLAVITGSVLLVILILVIIALFDAQSLSSRVGSMEQELASQVASGQQQIYNQVASTQQDLSHQLTHDVTPPPAAPSISASCFPAFTPSGGYLGYYNCTASVTAQGTIEWKLDGIAVKAGATASIPVLHHSHQIQAFLTTSAGTASSPPQTVVGF